MQDRWTNPEGQSRSKIQIVAEHVEFKPRVKKEGDGKDDEEPRPTPRPRRGRRKPG